MSSHHDSKSTGSKQSQAPNVIDKVLEDHAKVKKLYKELQSADNHHGEKLYQKMCWEIALHAVAEELVLYPLEESLDKEGKKMAAEARDDHDKTKSDLQELDGKTLKEAGVREKVDSMMKDLLEHMEKEETGDLVKMKKEISEDKLMTAAKDFDQVKLLVPDVASSNQAHSEKQADKSEKDSHFKTPMSLLLASKEKLRGIMGEHGKSESISVNKEHADGKASGQEKPHDGKASGQEKSHDGHKGSSKSHDGHSAGAEQQSHDGRKSHADQSKDHKDGVSRLGQEKGDESTDIPYNLRHRDEAGHVVAEDSRDDTAGRKSGEKAQQNSSTKSSHDKAQDGAHHTSPSKTGHSKDQAVHSSDAQQDVDMSSQESGKGRHGNGNKNGDHKEAGDHTKGGQHKNGNGQDADGGKGHHGKRGNEEEGSDGNSRKKVADSRGEMEVDGHNNA